MLRREHRAQELGITHLDTSDVYGPHTNEVLVGEYSSFQNRSAFLLPSSQIPLLPHILPVHLLSVFAEAYNLCLYVICTGKAIKGRRDEYLVATKFGVSVSYTEKVSVAASLCTLKEDPAFSRRNNPNSRTPV